MDLWSFSGLPPAAWRLFFGVSAIEIEALVSCLQMRQMRTEKQSKNRQ